MKDDAAPHPTSAPAAVDSVHDPEELPVKVHDYAGVCRRELERLENLQSEAAAGYQGAREAVARLESLATAVHPMLAEKIRRVTAVVRRMGSESTHDAGDRYPSLYNRLYNLLQEIQDSPLWALPVSSRASTAAAKPIPTGPVLKPGDIFPDRVVLYMLGDLHFMVRGTLRYNLHRADLSREYAARRGGPVLPIFPNPDRDSQAFPAPAYGGNLMVFASRTEGEREHLGLRYDRILGIEDYQPARHDRGVEVLAKEHPIVAGRLARGGVDYYVVRL